MSRVLLASAVATVAVSQARACQLDASMDCDKGGQVVTALVANNCGGDYEWSVSGTAASAASINAGAAGEALVTFNSQTLCVGDVHVTVKETCGNVTTSCTASATFSDSEGPEMSGPADLVGPNFVECDDIPAVGLASVDSDACGGVPAHPTISFDKIDNPVNVNAHEEYYYCHNFLERQWSSADTCGNNATFTQTVEIRDTTPPTLHTVEEDVTVQCGYVPADCVVTGQDNCGGAGVNHVNNMVGTEGVCGPNDIIAIHYHSWTATDSCGLTFTDYQTVTVIDDIAPTLSQYPQDADVDCSSIPAVPSVTASDNCEGATTWGDVAGHNPLTLGKVYPIEVQFATSRTGGAQTYQEVRTWSATDKCGNSVSHEQTVTVSDTTPPTLTGIEEDKHYECDDVPPPCVVTASDDCDASVEYKLTSKTNSDGCDHKYNIVYTWTVTDSSGNTNSQSQTVFVNDNTAPSIAGVPASGGTYDCLSEPKANPVASDNCGDATLTESKSFSEVCEGSGSTEIVYTAVDACGNSATKTWTYTTEDKTPPIFQSTPQKDITTECTHTVPVVDAVAIDLCTANPLVSYTVTGGKADLSDCGNAGETRSWTAEDDCGNTNKFEQQITYVDTTPPNITPPTGGDIPCDAIHTVDDATADDDCSEEVLVQRGADSTISHNCTKDGFEATWTATDNCGLQATASAQYTYYDTVPPECTVTDATWKCSDGENWPTPDVQCDDTCDNEVTAEVSSSVNCGDDGCLCDFKIVYSYTASDDCGNTKSSDNAQTLTHSDLTAPSLDAGNLSCTDECNSCSVKIEESYSEDECYTYTDTTYTPVDACGNTGVPATVPSQTAKPTSIDWTFFPTDTDEECGDWANPSNSIPAARVTALTATAGPGNTTVAFVSSEIRVDGQVHTGAVEGCTYDACVTVRATHVCGDTVDGTYCVTHTDTAPPTITAPEDQTVDCSANYTALSANAAVHDNCDSVELDVEVTTTWSCDAGSVCTGSATYTVTDTCGNTATDSQALAREDTTPPTITVSDCNSDCTFPTCDAPSVADDCGTTELTSENYRETGACDYEKCVTTKYTVTDDSGNTNSAMSTACSVIPADKQARWTTDPLPASFSTKYCDIPDPETVDAIGTCDSPAVVSFSRKETSTEVTDSWSFEDACVWPLSHTQTISLLNDPPVVTCTSETIVLNCTDPTPDHSASYDDDCGASLVVEESTVEGCGNSKTVTRTISAVDEKGQIASVSCTIVYKHEDSSPPQFDKGVWTDDCGTVSEICMIGDICECPEKCYSVTTCTATDECGRTNTNTVQGPESTPSEFKWATSVDAREHDCAVGNAPPNPTSDPVTNKPSASTVTGPSGAVSIPAAGPCDDFQYEWTWTAVDQCGANLTYTVQEWVRDNTPPTITPPADTTYDCLGAPHFGDFTVHDDCHTASVMPGSSTSADKKCAFALDECGNQSEEVCATSTFYQANYTAKLVGVPTFTGCSATAPDHTDFDVKVVDDYCGSNLEFSMETVGDECYTQYIYTWHATDSYGLDDTQSATACVEDTTPPTLAPLPSDMTIYGVLPSPQNPPVMVNSDNTGSYPAPAGFSQVKLEADADCLGTDPSKYGLYIIRRTWDGSDACGVVTHSQDICVRTICADCCPGLPDDTNADCDNIPSPQAAQDGLNAAKGNNTLSAVEETYIHDTHSSNCAQFYKIVRTWTLTSPLGVESICPMTITVTDDVAPVFDSFVDNQEGDCAYPDLTVTATDQCADTSAGPGSNYASGQVTVEESVSETIGKVCKTRTHSFVATDACGKTTSTTATTKSCDRTPPTLTIPEDDENGICGADLVAGSASHDDTCCESTVNSTKADFPGCNPDIPGAIFTFTATDCHGNTASDQQTISSVDRTAPTLSPITVADKTGECPAMPTMTPPTATDCEADTKVEESTSVIDKYTTEYTWTASDGCGNTATLSATASMHDTQPPSLNQYPGDETHNCAQDHPWPKVTASDDCDANPEVLKSETKTEDCVDRYTIVRTWVAKDESSWASAVHSQTITVYDGEAPKFTSPDSIFEDSSDACNLPSFADPNYSDNCGAVTLDTLDTDNSSACSTEKIREYTLTDSCGQTAASKTHKISAGPVSGIVLKNIPADVAAECNDGVSHPDPSAAVFAEDDCGNNYNVKVTVGDSGDSCVSTRVITWEVQDICGQDSQSQTSTISDTTPPNIVAPEDYTRRCGADNSGAPTMFATVFDDCDGGSSQVQGVPSPSTDLAPACTDEYVVTFTAADDCGNQNTATTTVTITDTSKPIVYWEEGDAYFECDQPATYEPAYEVRDECWSNNDLNITVTPSSSFVGHCGTVVYSLCAADKCGNSACAAGTVTHTTVDSTPPTIPAIGDIELDCLESYTPPTTSNATENCGSVSENLEEGDVTGTSCKSTQLFTWEATNDCGYKSYENYTVTTRDTTPPTITWPAKAPTTTSCSKPSIEATASDDCSGASVTTTSTDAPASWCSGTLTYTATAADNCGNSATSTHQVTYADNTPPVITITTSSPETVECAEDPSTSVAEASDACEGKVDVFSSTTGTNLDSEITIAYTASDSCGNTDSKDEVIKVYDTTPPVCTWPLDEDYECQDPTGAQPSCDDACSTVSVTLNEEKTELCTGGYVILNHWSASDVAGNSVSHTQTVTSVDSTPPFFVMEPSDSDVDSCTSYFVPPPQVDDDCSGTKMSEENVFTGDSCSGTDVFTWTLTDNCGNSASTSAVVTITDTTPPTFNGGGVTDYSVEFPCGSTNCDAVVHTATDDCNNATVTSSTVSSGDACYETHEHTFSAVDKCGNEATRSYTVIVEDTTPPVIELNDDLSLEADFSNVPGTPIVTCTDAQACTVVYLGEVKSNDKSACKYTLTRTWKAVDPCGNFDTVSQVITVTDDDKLAWSEAPADSVHECDAAAPDCDAVAVDSCDGVLNVKKTSYTLAAASGTQEVAVTVYQFHATDSAGNNINHSTTVTSLDTTPPSFSHLPEDLVLECDCDTQPAKVSVFDNCDASILIQESESNGVTTWSAVDAVGNTASHSRTVTVVDTTAPTLAYTPGDATIGCDQTVSEDNYARDNCDDTVSVSVVRADSGDSCASVATLTWTAQDTAGNTATHVQKVKQVDDAAPRDYNTRSQLCILPGEVTEGVVFEVSELFDVHDACGTVTFSHTSCNSTATTYYNGGCTYDEATGYTVLTAPEGNGATWSVYGVASDECGNELSLKKDIIRPSAFATAPAGCAPVDTISGGK